MIGSPTGAIKSRGGGRGSHATALTMPEICTVPMGSNPAGVLYPR